jgi:hypothetical protein
MLHRVRLSFVDARLFIPEEMVSKPRTAAEGDAIERSFREGFHLTGSRPSLGYAFAV